MNPAQVKERLTAVLSNIQANSGLDCPRLTGETKPVSEIPEFDSKVWLVAITLLSIDIDVTIPNNVNIFIDEDTEQPRSIDETANFVSKLAAQQANKEIAAP